MKLLCTTLLSLGFVLVSLHPASAQGVLIGNESGSPDPAAVLEVQSDFQGFLPPRLTTAQRDLISNPPAGLRIYNIDSGCENFYSGVTERWMSICGSCAPQPPVSVQWTPDFYEVTFSWNPVEGADGYMWNTVNDYFSATDLGSQTSVTNYVGSPGYDASIYLWSYNASCGESERPRLVVASTCPWASIGSSDPIISSNQIIWKWYGSEATGFKVSEVEDFETATDVGLSTTFLSADLSPNTNYTLYVWWYFGEGSGCVEMITLNATTVSEGCTIGAIGPGGGIIFYCGEAYAGKIGLEISSTDVSSGAEWGCFGTDLPGAQGINIGTGQQNTADIVSGCATTGIAARLCDQLDSGSQTDWFLPSYYELQKTWYNLTNTPGAFAEAGFQNSLYWASSEQSWMSTNTAYAMHFGANYGTSANKNLIYPVRCVRAF
jgi:hypothetical protein